MSELERKIKAISEEALERIKKSSDLAELNDMRVNVLGKKGSLTAILKSMKDVAPEDRPKVGQWVNDARKLIEEKLDSAKKAFEEEKLRRQLENEKIDVTLPSRKDSLGHAHPNTIALKEVERIFVGMGYEVLEGPEIEYDEYNFTKLNIPAGHPAKDEQDTFYITKDILLRTQTSPIQARVMEQGKLPIRMIAPGRVFRSDEVDATHSPSFHQIEGLVIDKNITFADLKGTLQVFAEELFGPETKTRFRPHHFPFTEPSAEMDVSCFKCGGKGCRFCKNEGWIEILGCGMVHPHVLDMCGIDKEEYRGFAFGVGLERIALLKYEIDDMRLLYENDIRFLRQF
ncbi:MAG: phenylalanine--tRNA ligase subunit alpha [Lachnospiraceae bacterium]|jgi:phenylalanyl-tRNA synthetase alpha chain